MVPSMRRSTSRASSLSESRGERVDGEIEREIHRSSIDDDARAVLTTMDAIDRISANLVLDPDFRT